MRWVIITRLQVRAILGAGRDDAKEVRILNRYVRWKSDGGKNWMEYEPDPRHAELIVEPGECEGCDDSISQEKAGRCVDDISTAGRIANEKISQRGDESGVFVARQARSVILDEGVGTRHAETDGTIDDQFEASRSKHPQQTLYDWTCVVTVTMPGCLKTRKSTTGMVLMRDAHCLKVSSHTQSTISRSSGESEYYGIVKCAAIGEGARSMLSDFGMCADVVERTDSSSGLAVGSRRGLGRPACANSLLVGTATSTAGRPSLEEGTGRHQCE